MELSRLIDFDRVDVISQMSYPPRPVLVVGGVLPTPGTTVTLVPLMYISRPQYYGIQVVGTIENIGAQPMPVAEPAEYHVQLDLTGITGTEGIEVIGATRTERVALPTPEPTEESS
ncbi:hypothetical protein ACPPVO_20215 [Dactylosporangium sp. McL0621]|uniref:hypothetical protein n=1 Tax=Dactylosporangium sp. McL0621 TaxID=3415678 RepID=UPI003CF46BC0